MQIWPLLLSSWACLDYGSFAVKKAERECEALQQCNPDIPCDPPDTGGAADCDFDAGAARDCLDGVFTCGGEPHFEYPIAPQVCATVCGDLIF